MKGERWSSDDDHQVRQMMRAGASIKEVAKALGRSSKAVSGRLATAHGFHSPAAFRTRAHLAGLRGRLTEATLDVVFAAVGARERAILASRFGLIDSQPLTLEQVGSQFGVTRERIRQVENQAIRTLCHRVRQRELSSRLQRLGLPGSDL